MLLKQENSISFIQPSSKGMATSAFHFDTRICRRHVPLLTQQHRLRHLRSISARNITFKDNNGNVSDMGVYFTLHLDPHLPAFYTSENVYNSTNPSWRSFESSSFLENVYNSASSITVRIWACDTHSLIIEWIVHFTGLSFLSEQVPKDGKKFKPNTILFGMLEGYYGCSDCYQLNNAEVDYVSPQDHILIDPSLIRVSYSVSTLYRIKTIEKAVKQIQASVNKLRNDIEERLQKTRIVQASYAQHELLKLKITMLQTELQNQKSKLEILKDQKDHWEQNVESRRSSLACKCTQLREDTESLNFMKQQYFQYRENFLKTSAQLVFRRKQLISELFYIYPITEFPDKLGYSICGVYLPNSEDFAGHDDMMISVALGYVCHLVLMISQFLNLPLRYPLHYYGSRSSIMDFINDKIPDKDRQFYLYSKGRDKYHFNYGVYLLNKNISQLRRYYELNTPDLRATLLNLHSLIELRLSVHSEQYSMLQTPVPPVSTLPFLVNSDETDFKNCDRVLQTSKCTQNGLMASEKLETLSVSGNFHQCIKRKEGNAEMEDLKKEMEEMMPTINKQKTEDGLICGKINDISAVNLSCSLDKGLNDIKVLQQSLEIYQSGSSPEPDKAKIKLRKLGQSCHHSSVPNLTSNLSCVSFDIDREEFFSSEEQYHPLNAELTVWTAGSSCNNSDDEQLQNSRNPVSNTVDGISETLWCFNETSSWTTVTHNVGGNTNDSFPHYSEKHCDHLHQMTDIDMLNESDFSTDLSVRTDQLASRTGSFCLQKGQTSNSLGSTN